MPPPPDPLGEESLEELYEHAPCGYASTSPDGTILRANATLLGWLGLARDEVVGTKRFVELLSVAGRIYHETHFAPLLRMQRGVREIALEVVAKGGQRIPVLVSADVHADQEGVARVVRMTIFDASERRRYERELLAARRRAEHVAKAKAEFLAMVSHEIRTPLNAIVSVGHLLERSGVQPAQEKYVRILRSSSASLLALVNDILDFSKIEAGKMTLDERSFSLAELIEGLVLAQQGKAEEKQNVLVAEIDPVVPAFLVGDPVKIGQVLANLVGNALKFTSGGRVVVAAEVLDLGERDARIRVAVRDTGIGIPKDKLAAIFDEFEQASADTGTKFGGTGLGLAISRRLVELHGGKLEVESEPGAGSTFRMDLRLRIGEATAASRARAASDEAHTLRGLRALVADDNEVNVFLLTRFLERWGIAYVDVRNGLEAVERARTERFDVVLMDLRMPELDGCEAARRIREGAKEGARPAVIAMSASMRSSNDEALAASGFDDFVPKPFDPEQLYRKIALHAGRPLAVSSDGPALVPWRGTEHVAVLPDFDVEALRGSLHGGSPGSLFAAAAREIEDARAEVRAAARARDGEALATTMRRVRSTLELMRAHALWAALRRLRRLVDVASTPDEHVEAALLAVDWEVDEILAALATARSAPG